MSVVRSDDPALPVPPTARLDYGHIRIVRPAVEQEDLRERLQALRPGDDGVVDVVLKVLIVHAAHVQGDIATARRQGAA